MSHKSENLIRKKIGSREKDLNEVKNFFFIYFYSFFIAK